MSQPSKLKTTYKATESAGAPAPLPAGWTEHRAPTGHLYYYNSSTKQSTYKRPVETPKVEPQPIPSFPLTTQLPNFQAQSYPQVAPTWSHHQTQDGVQQHGAQPFRRRPPPQDRPKHKQPIPGVEPWLLIRTKLRRRFVHNPHTGESLWKFPKDVMKAVVELDIADRERRQRHEQGIYSDEEKPQETASGLGKKEGDGAEEDSDEYEEVEVTDDEDEDGPDSKRQRTEDEGAPPGPVEFGEDDIAFQLAQMEAAADGYGDEYYEEDAPELSEEDSRALFMDLLDDFKISPFTPWDSIIADGRIIDDDRYTVLPNMKSRREVFDDWVRARAAEVRQKREEQAKQDPRIPYMAFLAAKATPKLYWPEFRRKYQKDAEMKDRKLTDKEREKWYREHINRLKLSESERKKDLRKLLESLPPGELNRSTSMEALPGSLLRDIRYISLPAKVRDPLVDGFIQIAPDAPDAASELPPEEVERRRREQANRERREKALAEREKVVREQKERQRRDLAYSKNLLREEEAEVQRAMAVGREGLLTHLDDGKDSPMGADAP